MSFIAGRTVSLITPEEDERFGKENLSLSDFATDRGYVLLGEPGMGKSTAFREESERSRSSVFISARRFIGRKPERHPEWKIGPLFIDGLDEVRVGGGNPLDTIDKIIDHIENLEIPQFRLSCRPSSWLGDCDLQELASLLGSNRIPVLQLNPLNYGDIQQIIGDRLDDSKLPGLFPKLNCGDNRNSVTEREKVVNTFIWQAHDQGLESFLYNPRLLSLLLEAIVPSGWCSSPTETFEKACYQLFGEHNRERRIAREFDMQPPSPDEILRQAGLLSALLLIGNKTGWTIQDNRSPDILSLSEVDTSNQRSLRSAFDSSIFVDTPDCRAPLHRLIAEFLGARYLDEKIQNGLRWRRALSLLLGHDGIPLPDLRGLAAWLAAFNTDIRSTLIQLDPIAVAFNGDTSHFKPEERKELFRNLQQHIHLGKVFPSTASLGALAGNQGLSAIRDLTDSSERSENRQDLVYFLLHGVSHTYIDISRSRKLVSEQQQEDDHENLLKILYDPSWNLSIRRQALYALNRVLAGNPDHGAVLRKLLQDLIEKKLSDEKNELLGTVLDYSYPGELQPAELWDYLVTEPIRYPFNSYLNFFSSLNEKSDGIQIKGLLEPLCDQAPQVIPKLAHISCADLVLKLLEKGLRLFGDQLDIPKLYRWFELIKFDDYLSQLIPVHASDLRSRTTNHEANTAIFDWLSERKKVQYKLVEYGLIKHQDKIGNIMLDRTLGRKFIGENVTEEFRSWCLTRAIELAHGEPSVAVELARWSIFVGQGWQNPICDDEVTQKVSDIPSLREWNRKRLARMAEEEREEAERKKENTKLAPTSFENQRQYELSYLRLHEDELAEGRCAPEILDKLARIYFYGRIAKNSPETGLSYYLERDQKLIDAALRGFRSLLDHDGLPDLDEIAEIHEKGQRSYLARPFLAALEGEEENVLSHLSEKGKRRALGFYLVTDLPQPQDPIFNQPLNTLSPPWYKYALTNYPQAVADALISVHRACVRSKAYPIEQLFKMASDEAYARVAPLAVSKKIITVFPTKCSGFQLESLKAVLLSILRVYDMPSEELRKEDLKEIILKRLDRKNMDVAQQAVLLSAGLCIAPDRCLQRFADFLSTGREPRIRHVFNFLELGGRQTLLKNLSRWDASKLSLLIQTIGNHVQPPILRNGPHTLNSQEFITKRFQDLLDPCIEELSNRSDYNAFQALEELVSDPNLATWKRLIEQAQDAQAQRQRASKRTDLTVAEIQNTLHGGPPANAADLKCLTVDILKDLAIRIRDESTDDWDQYWESDQSPQSIPRAPKYENACRNRLLSDLRLLLMYYNLDAQPESSCADGTRVDISVSYGSNLAIPIEIKRNLSRDLWKGITQQLVPKYTRAPKSDGYGIYLVFWFGEEYMEITSPCGKLPKNPQELKVLLEHHIGPSLKNFITVIVIDVSPPNKYKGDTTKPSL